MIHPATPLPWKLFHEKSNKIVDDDNNIIADTFRLGENCRETINAKYITVACNEFHGLVDELTLRVDSLCQEMNRRKDIGQSDCLQLRTEFDFAMARLKRCGVKYEAK